MLLSAVLGLFFGTYVDHHRKKTAMLNSSLVSLVAFSLASLVFLSVPQADLLNLGGWAFWVFALLILAGAVAGNMRYIAMATVVTMLVPKKDHDRANGMVGAVNGFAFAVTSVFSGIVIGFWGMGWALIIAIIATVISVLHLLTVKVVEKEIVHLAEAPKRIDVKGALAAIHAVPGLLALIFYTTFNNFLGGVFMALMDPYGLNLVSVQTWGFIWGFLSFGYVFGGLIVAKKGLGKSPLRSLFITNIVMWSVCILFPWRTSIIILVIAMLIYMSLVPIIEAAEQTIVQKVVPFKQQGRVFGFAQSVESAASPITAFLIGPLAQFMVIPYMTTGGGVNGIGSWFGTGPARAMALIFIIAGFIGLVITLLAMRSRSYQILSKNYQSAKGSNPVPAQT